MRVTGDNNPNQQTFDQEEGLKRILYAASSIALLASVVLVGNASGHNLGIAGGVRNSSVAAKPIPVQLCTSTPFGIPSLKPDSQGIRNGVFLAYEWLKPRLT